MSSLTPEQLRSVLIRAARAPSGDNTQPWSFAWDGETLSILFNPEKTRHVLDAGLSAARIALGCLLESLEIAASEYGHFALWKLLPLSQENAGTAAELQFVSGARGPDDLLDALERRTTDRRPFRKGALPLEGMMRVWDSFPAKDRVGLHLVESLSPELESYIIAAESLTTSHPSIFLNTLPWIRLSRREIERTMDGMPWRGTGVGYLEYPFLQFVRAFPGSFPVVSRTGMRLVHSAMVKRLLRSSAGLFCVSVRDEHPSSLIDAGRLAMRVWLRLTQANYGVQPLTISSLSIYNGKIGVLDADSQRLFAERYKEGEQILRKAFHIPESNFPVWMLRTGLSSPLPQDWLTPRKPLDQILRTTTDQPAHAANS